MWQETISVNVAWSYNKYLALLTEQSIPYCFNTGSIQFLDNVLKGHMILFGENEITSQVK